MVTLKEVQSQLASGILKTCGVSVEVTIISAEGFSVLASSEEDLNKAVELLLQVPGVSLDTRESYPDEALFVAYFGQEAA